MDATENELAIFEDFPLTAEKNWYKFRNAQCLLEKEHRSQSEIAQLANKMTDKIYIWDAKDGNVGHASMKLQDGTYISWWPKDDKTKSTMSTHWKSVESETMSTYNQDVQNEGKPADSMIEIPAGRLNTPAMNSWWGQFKDTSKYHMLGNNCCSAVYEALRQGGATNYKGFPLTPISTPANLKQYATKLSE